MNLNYGLTWVLLCGFLVSTGQTRLSRRNSLTTTSEYLMIMKCKAKCLDDIVCEETCLRQLRSENKLGSCPKRPIAHEAQYQQNRISGYNDTQGNFFFDPNCIDMCGHWDYNCPHAERCCQTTCGTSCQRPPDLDRIKELPPTPCKLTVMESGRNIEICWKIYTEIRVNINDVFFKVF